MRDTKDRCEHCGKWVVSQHLYTLFELVDHPECESAAICEPCCFRYSADYWKQWLDNRFGTKEGSMKQLSAGEWITTGEAAQLLDIEERTVRLWAKQGKVTAQQVGRNWIVLKSSLEGKSKDKHGRGRPRKVNNSQKP